MLLVYVDDMVLTRTSKVQIDVKLALDKEFTIKDLGDLMYFLVIEIIRNKSGTLLSHRKYITNIIKDLQLDRSSPVTSSLRKGLGLSTLTWEKSWQNLSNIESKLGDCCFLISQDLICLM